MSILLSTGPVENAAANASTSIWIKILNNNQTGEISAEAIIFNLNGEKSQIANSSFMVAAMSSEYDVFEITYVLQYEVQILLSDDQNVLVSVWGKDADANLVAAHRFMNNDLSVLGQTAGQEIPMTRSVSLPVSKKKTNRHHNR